MSRINLEKFVLCSSLCREMRFLVQLFVILHQQEFPSRISLRLPAKDHRTGLRKCPHAFSCLLPPPSPVYPNFRVWAAGFAPAFEMVAGDPPAYAEAGSPFTPARKILRQKRDSAGRQLLSWRYCHHSKLQEHFHIRSKTEINHLSF